VGVAAGAACLPPTYVGSYRGRSDCRLSLGKGMRPDGRQRFLPAGVHPSMRYGPPV